ncbi:hypothetical protein [Formosa sp. S-31]|uniref:hypothetical protein n=1 Tax=Formosa sp. S-31 TaxID=2790949 RepID=UPI003EBBA375
MKKILILALVFMSLNAFAQQRGQGFNQNGRNEMAMGMKMNNFTPEQQATLQTKRMTLHLDLTDSQQKEVYNLNLNLAKTRDANRKAMLANKESGKTFTDDERYNLMVKRLDNQITYNAKMKSILKSEQYELWNANHRQGMRQNYFDCPQNPRPYNQKKQRRNQ